MKIKKIYYPALSGSCIGIATMLLATDIIIGLVAGVLTTAGIFFAIYAYK